MYNLSGIELRRIMMLEVHCMEKREIKVINGIKITSITPNLSEEETAEAANYIINGLRNIIEKRNERKSDSHR